MKIRFCTHGHLNFSVQQFFSHLVFSKEKICLSRPVVCVDLFFLTSPDEPSCYRTIFCKSNKMRERSSVQLVSYSNKCICRLGVREGTWGHSAPHPVHNGRLHDGVGVYVWGVLLNSRNLNYSALGLAIDFLLDRLTEYRALGQWHAIAFPGRDL